MKLLDKLFGKNNKIKVQFINNLNGATIGVAEMLPGQLPESFSVPTTMHIHENDWTVEEAIPENAADFIQSKQLILKMRKVEYVDPKDILFTLPTISNELPNMEDRSIYNHFEVSILEDDWRQNEFLNKSSYPLVDIEVAKIQDIWANNSKETGASFPAFNKCHVRDVIGAPGLTVNFEALKNLLKTEEVGSLKLNSNNGFVLSGFSIKTENTTYYGVVNNQIVDHLCVSRYSDHSITEIENIVRTFDLIFINWYHGDLITGND